MKKCTDSVAVSICWLEKRAQTDLSLPAYQTPGASGLDIRAAVVEEVRLDPGDIFLVPTGFALAIPEGYEGQVRPRSGLAARYGITVVNSPGTIDADYRGEIKVPLIHLGREPFSIKRGERIAQLVFSPVQRVKLLEVESLDTTSRGVGGFGHTGR